MDESTRFEKEGGAGGLLSHCEPRLDNVGETMLARALLAPFRGALARYASVRVVELGLGRKFAYVVTETGNVGIAFSWLDEPIPSSVALSEPKLVDLVKLAWVHPVLTSLALAAANAAMQALLDEDTSLVCFDCNFVELLGLSGSDRVAVVGYVPGIVNRIAEKVGSITVFEDNPMHRREAEKDGLSTLPGSQLLIDNNYNVVVATGSSLIDPRVYIAVRLIKPRVFGVIGPTSSFHPETARILGVNVYGGSFIPKEERYRFLRLVKAGYGFRVLRRLVKKWAVKVE